MLPACADPARILILSNEDSTWTPADYAEVDLEIARMQNGLIEQGFHTEVFTVRHSVVHELGQQTCYPRDRWLVFNWCEQYIDRPWTDAEIAGELEQLGYVFTGADMAGMRLSLDKAQVRQRLETAGVPVPIGRVYADEHVDEWTTFPAIVKPANQHSSFGVSRQSLVQNPAELRRQVQWVLAEFGGPAVVEEFVDGREIHVALIGNRDVLVLPPMEIDYSLFGDIHDRIYTNEAKFDKHNLPYYLTKFLCPAPLNAATQQRVEEVALAAYRLGGCRDYGRVDLRLRAGTPGGDPVVLDVNPNADLSFESDHAIGSKMLGWTYGQMAARIVACARERWPERN
jgi:D-alanine-D-alanine ligase